MNTQFRKGVIEMCVLALIDRKDMYGYEIVQSIAFYTEINEAPDPGGIFCDLPEGEHRWTRPQILSHHRKGKGLPRFAQGGLGRFFKDGQRYFER